MHNTHQFFFCGSALPRRLPSVSLVLHFRAAATRFEELTERTKNGLRLAGGSTRTTSRTGPGRSPTRLAERDQANLATAPRGGRPRWLQPPRQASLAAPTFPDCCGSCRVVDSNRKSSSTAAACVGGVRARAHRVPRGAGRPAEARHPRHVQGARRHVRPQQPRHPGLALLLPRRPRRARSNSASSSSSSLWPGSSSSSSSS